jgi:hypothetical protein
LAEQGHTRAVVWDFIYFFPFNFISVLNFLQFPPKEIVPPILFNPNPKLEKIAPPPKKKGEKKVFVKLGLIT